ncbi:MAG: hypothetical protein Q8N68_00685, partial [bacterium]|nr:hypothetical protein [bacterium]
MLVLEKQNNKLEHEQAAMADLEANKRSSGRRTLGQLFILLAIMFFAITAMAYNRDFGEPVSWRMIFLATVLLAFCATYFFRSLLILIFSLLGFYFWFLIQVSYWVGQEGLNANIAVISFALLALIYYLVGNIHKTKLRFEGFPETYMVFGLVAATGLMLLFSTEAGLRILTDGGQGNFWLSWQTA